MTDTEIEQLADFDNAFWRRFRVTKEDLDGFHHVNNAVYLKWLDATVWAHTEVLGITAEVCLKLERGMAVARHEINYLSSAFLDDEIVVFVWITSNDGRLRSSRVFQVMRLSDRKTILRAQTDYVSTNLTTGRPVKMPEIFKTGYAVTLPDQARG